MQHPPGLQIILDYFLTIVCDGDTVKYENLLEATACGCNQPNQQEDAWKVIRYLTRHYRPNAKELEEFNGQTAHEYFIESVFEVARNVTRH
jgi:hypothetical protein